jgi:hypothetical protein
LSEFPNPYIATREKSQGELTQEYASLFNMASLLFGLSFTDTEKRAAAVVIGAVMRERKKIDFAQVADLLKRFLPQT